MWTLSFVNLCVYKIYYIEEKEIQTKKKLVTVYDETVNILRKRNR